MELINITEATTSERPALKLLVDSLLDCQVNQELEKDELYHDFPVYRTEDDDLLKSELALLGPKSGLILFAATDARDLLSLQSIDSSLNEVFSILYSRLLRTKELQETRTELCFEPAAFIFAPNFQDPETITELANEVINSAASLNTKLATAIQNIRLTPEQVRQLRATFQGARGLLRSKIRQFNGSENKIAKVLTRLESEMAGFDLKQAEGYITELDGPQRIRGLAGSGKTVVLSMKAALAHLRHPEARILYTFHTKALYQHVKRTITRFYREFDDRDPDWDRIQILHSWGGSRNPGVYYTAAIRSNEDVLTFPQAKKLDRDDPLGAACKQLLTNAEISPYYDYCFIDEGQDFSASFIQLCRKMTKEDKFILGFDELQTIFRTTVPSAKEIFGEKDGKPALEFTRDTVLSVCYRNPREVLVAAHAVGFGIYGHIRQMLQDKVHWENVGYVVREGEFREGEKIVIERPVENSLPIVSESFTPQEIVTCQVAKDLSSEVNLIVESIVKDVEAGLRPDDILVVVVDDRSARDYLRMIRSSLAQHEIISNDVHTDIYGIPDFVIKDSVTLSTVHKAKGNEAFVVYVAGVDSRFVADPTITDRNILFTAMTRAKGFLRCSGIGKSAERFKKEVETALANFPNLVFNYPGDKGMQRIRRDWKASDARKGRAEAEIDRLIQKYGSQLVEDLWVQKQQKGS